MPLLPECYTVLAETRKELRGRAAHRTYPSCTRMSFDSLENYALNTPEGPERVKKRDDGENNKEMRLKMIIAMRTEK